MTDIKECEHEFKWTHFALILPSGYRDAESGRLHVEVCPKCGLLRVPELEREAKV